MLNTRVAQIKRSLSYFDKALIKESRLYGRTKALLVELELWNEERKNNIENIWAVHLETGKLSHVTPGNLILKL